jgi:hypothetical protein
MFIYFPEFCYRKTKEIFKSTFSLGISEQYAKAQIEKLFSEQTFNKQVEEIKKHNILLPRLNLKHCVRLSLNSILEPISNYDLITNEINICQNLVAKEDLGRVFLKEFSYFYSFNLKYAGKERNLNDLAQITLEACMKSYEHDNISKSVKNEIIKRCSFNEFKYKFKSEISEKYDTIDINNYIKKLIENNLTILN